MKKSGKQKKYKAKRFRLYITFKRPTGVVTMFTEGYLDTPTSAKFSVDIVAIPNDKQAIRADGHFQVEHRREIMATVHESFQVMAKYGRKRVVYK
jgi:hypothetical protein